MKLAGQAKVDFLMKDAVFVADNDPAKPARFGGAGNQKS